MSLPWRIRLLASSLLVASSLSAVATASAQGGRARRAAEKTRIGDALVRANDLGSAVAYFREAIQIDPRFERAYVALGELYRAQGRDSDALEVVRAGLRRRPRSTALALLFVAIVRSSDPLEAARVLRDAARADPGSLSVWRALGGLARERGAFAEALAAYRAVLRLTVDAPESEARAEAARFVRALRVLVVDVDPVSRCEDTEVRRALCGD